VSTLGRRALLIGGAGALLAGCGRGHDPAAPEGTVVSGSFSSEAMGGARTGWSIGYPKGFGPGDDLPVVISLHGRRADHRSTFTTLHLADAQARALAKQPTWPFALASVDGGDHSYWHRRADGTDAGRMVREEFVSLLEDRGLDTSRIGLYGWSMGGYGALLLAGKQRMPVRGVAVSSPALFTSAGFTPEGAFDDGDDFSRNDVYDHPEWLAGRWVRLDCGTSDPFHDATVDFCHRLEPVLQRAPASAFPGGGHTPDYWHRMAYPAFLFLAGLLHLEGDPPAR
jgi:S-formylglutathione hydrolase FrmB